MGLEVNIAVSCSMVVDEVVGHTLGFLIFVLDIIFNPISCRERKKRNTQTLMDQKLIPSSLISILCLFVPHPVGTCLSSGLAKYFLASFWDGIIHILSNGQTKSSELSHLAWVNQICSFSNALCLRLQSAIAHAIEIKHAVWNPIKVTNHPWHLESHN